MVLGVKTEMPCCYQHKTSNITGNGTETVLQDNRRGEIKCETDGRKEQSARQTERERESVSVKETVHDPEL